MAKVNDELEEQCEDAVFKICCTREKYSVRCANQLEKNLKLTTDILTKNYHRKIPHPKFDVPVITEEQQDLFSEFDSHKSKSHSSSNRDEMMAILNRTKELNTIATKIQRTRSSEFNKILEQ